MKKVMIFTAVVLFSVSAFSQNAAYAQRGSNRRAVATNTGTVETPVPGNSQNPKDGQGKGAGKPGKRNGSETRQGNASAGCGNPQGANTGNGQYDPGRQNGQYGSNRQNGPQVGNTQNGPRNHGQIVSGVANGTSREGRERGQAVSTTARSNAGKNQHGKHDEEESYNRSYSKNRYPATSYSSR